MTIEQNLPISDLHTPQMEQMKTIWQTLPDEHRLALALNFVDTIMVGEYRPYFLLLMAQKWPLQTDELEAAYPKIEITRLDLQRANLDEEEVKQLGDEHLIQIAETMRSHYIHDLFWPELRQLAQTFIESMTPQ